MMSLTFGLFSQRFKIQGRIALLLLGTRSTYVSVNGPNFIGRRWVRLTETIGYLHSFKYIDIRIS